MPFAVPAGVAGTVGDDSNTRPAADDCESHWIFYHHRLQTPFVLYRTGHAGGCGVDGIAGGVVVVVVVVVVVAPAEHSVEVASGDASPSSSAEQIQCHRKPRAYLCCSRPYSCSHPYSSRSYWVPLFPWN